MSTKKFSLISTITLLSLTLAHTQISAGDQYRYENGHKINKGVYIGQYNWPGESDETNAQTEAAIAKLPAKCQEMARQYSNLYIKIDELLTKRDPTNNPQVKEIKQILLDTKASLAWSVQSFREDVRNGTLTIGNTECQMGLESLNSTYQQIDKIGRAIK